MELLKKSEEKVKQVIYTLQLSDGVVHYKEWIDESGKIIDSQLVSKHGYDMSEEYELIEEIQKFIDTLE
jgi:hypothetical protein